MGIIATFGTGGSASSNWYDSATGPDHILNQIPDNNANLIVAKDIRDSVFTLWSMIKEVEVTAASGASAAQTYTNLNETPNPVGGIPAGSTFSNMNMKQMWDLLLYPYIPPSCNLSPINNKQYGANPSFSLNWFVTKNTLPIGEIWVNNVLQDPNLTTGSQPSTGTHLPNAGNLPSVTNTFTMSVSDTGTASNNTDTYSVNLIWMNTVYAGSIDLSSFGQSNVMNIPSYELAISNYIETTFSNIIIDRNDLSATKNRPSTVVIDGAGNFLFFAWPSALPGSSTPSFEVNNLPNTAFTMINDSFLHENASGFTAEYTIWLSNTAQNSPLNIKIS